MKRWKEKREGRVWRRFQENSNDWDVEVGRGKSYLVCISSTDFNVQTALEMRAHVLRSKSNVGSEFRRMYLLSRTGERMGPSPAENVKSRILWSVQRQFRSSVMCVLLYS